MVKNSLKNLIISSFSLLSMGLLAQEAPRKLTDSILQHKYGYHKADRLSVDTDSIYKYYVRANPKELMIQLDSLAMYGKFEESVLYVPSEEVVLELGVMETDTSAVSDMSIVYEINKIIPELEFYHTHLAKADRELTTKIPSMKDLFAFMRSSIITSAQNKDSKFTGGSVSIYGLTSYSIHNKDYLKQGYEYVEDENWTAFNEFAYHLTKSTRDFLISDLLLWDRTYVPMNSHHDPILRTHDCTNPLRYVLRTAPKDIVTGLRGASSVYFQIKYTPITPLAWKAYNLARMNPHMTISILEPEQTPSKLGVNDGENK